MVTLAMMTTSSSSPCIYYRIVDNNKLVRGEFSNGVILDEQVLKTQPGMRRVASSTFAKAVERDEKFLLLAFRFAINLLPGVTFPSTIVSAGYFDALSAWILCASGHFFIYDIISCEQKFSLKNVLRDEKLCGCIDSTFSETFLHLYILREDGDVALLKLKGNLQDFVLETCLEINPPPNDEFCAKPIRILSFVSLDGNEFVLSVFASGRVDLMVFDDEKLILLDSILTNEKLTDAQILNDDGNFSLLLFDQSEKKIVVHVDFEEGRLTNIKKKRELKPLMDETFSFLKFQIDDSITTTDLVYLGESLKNQLPSLPEDNPELLKSPLFPINTKKAMITKLYIEGQVDPLLKSLNEAISQLLAKARQELTFVLCLKNQLEQENKGKIIHEQKLDISSLTMRMKKLIGRIEQVKNAQDKSLSEKLQYFNKRVKEMSFKLVEKKPDMSIEELTGLLERRVNLIDSQSSP